MPVRSERIQRVPLAWLPLTNVVTNLSMQSIGRSVDPISTFSHYRPAGNAGRIVAGKLRGLPADKIAGLQSAQRGFAPLDLEHCSYRLRWTDGLERVRNGALHNAADAAVATYE